MLRIMTSLLRNAPGPLKGPRALAADLLEGLADVISPPRDVEQPPPAPPYSPPEPRPAPVERVETAAVSEPAPAKRVETEVRAAKGETRPAADLAGAFAKVLENPKLTKRQDVKVLAIFWQAWQRKMGPITAKAASALGDEVGLTIRHENIRKVIRTRLKDKVNTSTVEGSQPPTFEYEMLGEGAAFFEREYLGKAD